MDEATRLRRQFRRTRDSKGGMTYLLDKGGIYHYSRRVPAAVLARDSSMPDAIRRSTGTDDFRVARAQAREWTRQDEEAWLCILEGRGSVAKWREGLRDQPDRTTHQAIELIEKRADKLRVREDLEAAGELSELPDALRLDPQAGPAVRALLEAKGQYPSWWDAWEDFEGKSGLKTKSKGAYSTAMRQLDKAKLPPPHAITRAQARDFLRDAALRLTPSTVRVYIAAATAVMSHLYDDERARTFRGHKLRHVKAATRILPITRHDIEKLISQGALPHDVGVFMRLCLGTGARRQEAFHGTYDLDRRVLVIPAEYAKLSKAREVPIADVLLPVAREWVQLRSTTGARNLRAISVAFARARDAAELPPTKRLHSCRHAFTTELARHGVPVDRRKRLTGHSNGADAHAGYVHLETEDLRADVQKVDFETNIMWP